MAITKEQRRLRIRRGIRNKVSGTAERPRLSVFKSNKAIYVQLIDDASGNTLASTSSAELGTATVNISLSKEVGKKLAEKASANGISSVVFDRGGYPYHGKIKALAEGAREGGLKF
ncbi:MULTISPECIES: 50S ribosomal protein L18 [Reichenbachiella]|uniref:Large ribosomal subunit protein uL18 n=1 Tax=Reichenbachiella agariperforans TaxID=156994 RepID=A0A1M6RMP9_REIAG|nr:MULTISPECIES: 50S ribosomal protein L18 [Reichenbachiella]MBU2915064.1 50S ribosomal protein L18 [Reichenbachiella agariperforans]RJE70491.1 50S ribosomal protein L18 [Reichenbachiella sp. MSK19-1]SHK33670.1 large subunit ribosomal protein L18 [Reichenbachiella agariperforans]